MRERGEGAKESLGDGARDVDGDGHWHIADCTAAAHPSRLIQGGGIFHLLIAINQSINPSIT